MADNENENPENLDGDMNGEPKIDEPKGPFKPMGIDVVKKNLSKLARTYGKSFKFINILNL